MTDIPYIITEWAQKGYGESDRRLVKKSKNTIIVEAMTRDALGSPSWNHRDEWYYEFNNPSVDPNWECEAIHALTNTVRSLNLELLRAKSPDSK